MTKQEQESEALGRARGGLGMSNYPAIFRGFLDKGVPESEIRPRQNIFTYDAWKALGRQVRKGEHGVKVLTFIDRESKELDEEGKKKHYRKPWRTTVFHVSQTDPINQQRAG